MAEDFEDPRKTALRARVAIAADAAGYTVDASRPTIPFPAEAELNGGIRADVVSVRSDGTRTLFFVRVEGSKPLPGWIANHVATSFLMDDTEIYVVVEGVGDSLRATCTKAGAGLLQLRDDDTFDKVLDYVAPDPSAAKAEFAKRLKEVRRRLDTKLNLNLSRLESNFQQSATVTANLSASDRDGYLSSIEALSVAWKAWGEAMSERLDALAATEDLDALNALEAEIVQGPPAHEAA